MAGKHDNVAEMQGLYGPFTIAERVLQRIWLQQDFTVAGARLQDGRPLEVLHPGRWNLLGGPDFRQARLRIAGQEVTGDVEVHFHARDWIAHGHSRDRAYAGVVLHVLLFPPDEGEGHAAATIPSLVLLPLLHRDLEEHAADEALERMTARDEWRRIAELATEPVEGLRVRLRELGVARWRSKVHFARRRVERLGWETAAHHTALEILGYRFNRQPMLEVAARRPLAAWRGETEIRAVLDLAAGRWKTHGVRPANQPVVRLEQYATWVRLRPDWPERLAEWAGRGLPAPGIDECTTAVRRRHRFLGLSCDLADKVCAGLVGGTRWHTLVCDGLLPLLAVRAGREDAGLWFHWPAGDVPDLIGRALRQLGVTGRREQAHCQGFSQGMLAWFIRQESGVVSG